MLKRSFIAGYEEKGRKNKRKKKSIFLCRKLIVYAIEN